MSVRTDLPQPLTWANTYFVNRQYGGWRPFGHFCALNGANCQGSAFLFGGWANLHFRVFFFFFLFFVAVPETVFPAVVYKHTMWAVRSHQSIGWYSVTMWEDKSWAANFYQQRFSRTVWVGAENNNWKYRTASPRFCQDKPDSLQSHWKHLQKAFTAEPTTVMDQQSCSAARRVEWVSLIPVGCRSVYDHNLGNASRIQRNQIPVLCIWKHMN